MTQLLKLPNPGEFHRIGRNVPDRVWDTDFEPRGGFERSHSDIAGAIWRVNGGVVEVTSSGGSDDMCIRRAGSFNPDQRSRLKVLGGDGFTYGGAANVQFGPTVRDTSSGSGFTGYQLVYRHATNVLFIEKRTNNSSTALTSNSFSFTVNIGDVMELEVIGNVLRGYINGNLILEVQDTEHKSGTPGARSFNFSSAHTLQLEYLEVESADFEEQAVPFSFVPEAAASGTPQIMFPPTERSKFAITFLNDSVNSNLVVGAGKITKPGYIIAAGLNRTGISHTAWGISETDTVPAAGTTDGTWKKFFGKDQTITQSASRLCGAYFMRPATPADAEEFTIYLNADGTTADRTFAFFLETDWELEEVARAVYDHPETGGGSSIWSRFQWASEPNLQHPFEPDVMYMLIMQTRDDNNTSDTWSLEGPQWGPVAAEADHSVAVGFSVTPLSRGSGSMSVGPIDEGPSGTGGDEGGVSILAFRNRRRADPFGFPVFASGAAAEPETPTPSVLHLPTSLWQSNDPRKSDPGAAYWFSPADFIRNGNLAVAWPDKSGQGHRLGKVGSLNLPTFGEDKGRPYLYFDGNAIIGDANFAHADSLKAELDAGGEITLYVICEPDSGLSTDFYNLVREGVGTSVGNNFQMAVIAVHVGNMSYEIRNRNTSYAFFGSTGTNAGMNNAMAVVELRVTQSNADLSINDGAYTASPTLTDTNFAASGDGLFFGGTSDGTSLDNAFRGKIYEVYGTITSDLGVKQALLDRFLLEYFPQGRTMPLELASILPWGGSGGSVITITETAATASASSGFSVSPVKISQSSSAFSGSSAFSATPNVLRTTSALMGSTSAFAVAASLAKTSSTAMAGTSNFTATPVTVRTSSVEATGSSAFSAAPVVIRATAAAFAGSSAFSATTAGVKASETAFAGSSAFSAAPVNIRTTAAAFAGSSAFSAFTAGQKTSSALMAGTSSLAVNAVMIRQTAVGIASSSAFSAAAQRIRDRSVSVSGASGFAAIPVSIVTTSAGFAGQSTFSVIGISSGAATVRSDEASKSRNRFALVDTGRNRFVLANKGNRTS